MPAKLETSWQRLRRSLHDAGPLYTAQNVVKTVMPEWLLRANTAFLVETDIRDWHRNQMADHEMRWATEKDADLFAQADMPREEFLGHLARGAHISICESDGVLGGYRIQETGDIDYYKWLRYRLARDVIWTTMAWTAPQFRGQGLHTRMQRFALSELSRQGYERKLASVDASNVSSIRATTKTSAVVGSVSFVRSFGLTVAWVNGQSKFGRWHNEDRLTLGSELFRKEPDRPCGPIDTARLERLIGKPTPRNLKQN